MRKYRILELKNDIFIPQLQESGDWQSWYWYPEMDYNETNGDISFPSLKEATKFIKGQKKEKVIKIHNL